MRFHCPLCNLEIARDLRVVTSLEQEFYNLPFPGPYSFESLVLQGRNRHRHLLLP